MKKTSLIKPLTGLPKHYYQITYQVTVDHEVTIELPIRGLTQRGDIVAYLHRHGIIQPKQEVIRIEEVEPNKRDFQERKPKKPDVIKTL